MADREALDANVLIQFFVKDDAAQAEAARGYLARAERGDVVPVLPVAILNEVVFVLGGRQYGYPREDLVRVVEAMLQLPIQILDGEEVATALDLFREPARGWADCLLAAYAHLRCGGRVASFDADFRKMPSVDWRPPPVD